MTFSKALKHENDIYKHLLLLLSGMWDSMSLLVNLFQGHLGRHYTH